MKICIIALLSIASSVSAIFYGNFFSRLKIYFSKRVEFWSVFSFVGRLQRSLQWCSTWLVKSRRPADKEDSSWFCQVCATNKTMHFPCRLEVHYGQPTEWRSCFTEKSRGIGYKSQPSSTICKMLCQRQWHIETTEEASKFRYTWSSCVNLWHVQF